jgi:hypothetical protein
MLPRLGFQSDAMILALAVWLCSLPLVAILVIPFFGLKTAAIVALGSLIVVLIICWGICWWPHQQVIPQALQGKE